MKAVLAIAEVSLVEVAAAVSLLGARAPRVITIAGKVHLVGLTADRDLTRHGKRLVDMADVRRHPRVYLMEVAEVAAGRKLRLATVDRRHQPFELKPKVSVGEAIVAQRVAL